MGYIYTAHHQLTDEEPALMEISSSSVIKLNRYGETARVEIQAESLETAGGAVRGFTVRTEAGATPLVVQGTRTNGTLKLVTQTSGKSTTQELPWNDSYGGLFAIDQALANSRLMCSAGRIPMVRSTSHRWWEFNKRPIGPAKNEHWPNQPILPLTWVATA